MKTLLRRTLPLCLVVASLPALAQRPPPSRPPPPKFPQGERQFVPTPPPGAGQPGAAAQPNTAVSGAVQPGAQAPAERNRTPNCEEIRRKARYGIYFDKVDIEKLVQTVSDATCRTFILPENVRGKISIVGPENGKAEVSADEFYAAFLSALDANGLTVAPVGNYFKIIDKRSAKQSTIPTYVDPSVQYTTNEQMITKLFKVKYAEVEPLRGVLQQLVSKDGDTISYPPDTLIINDIGSNMHRLEKLIEQLDTRSATDEVRVVQIKYASAQEVANTLQKIFEAKSKPGQRPGAPIAPPPGMGGNYGQPAPGESTGGGPITLSQMIPDERTNKLIIVASPAAFDRIQQLINEVDIPISGEGRINVYYLENANAEDIAGTLQSLAQGTANRPRTPAAAPPGAPPPPGPAKGQGVTAAELFAGEVKISADKSTNSLVIVASQNDYRNLVRVIEKLDIPRRQVFVEAVIMEINLDRSLSAGVDLHQGITLKTDQGNLPVLVGTKYTTQGLPPSFSLANLASFGGFLAGVQGPAIPELAKLGLTIPSFGVVLHALQQSSDVNVLSTPHLLTSDNEEAEITVGQNVPFQAGFSPSSLGALGTTGVPGLTGSTAIPNLGLGGLGSFFAPINRQNVELKLTIKPQINESDYIRLVLTEQTEEIASQDPVLGPTTSKRSAKTTVVARNQETVVIGGIMQDRTISSVSKVPILGDIPLLGHLFRETTERKVKTNLLLFLTPYIIKDQSDFRDIFEKKMKERQQFIEQFYGQVPGYDVTVDFSRKAGPLGKMNQAVLREESKVENGGAGTPGERLIQPAPGIIRPMNREVGAPPAPQPPGFQPPDRGPDEIQRPEGSSPPIPPPVNPPPPGGSPESSVPGGG